MPDKTAREITGSQQEVLDLVQRLARNYGISALDPLLRSCREAMSRSDLLVAVLGRFKAGKSSFLNHLLGRNILPVGVVPVTSVVTEIAFGNKDSVQIRFQDGHKQQVSLADLSAYVTEKENPQNQKQVAAASVQTPEVARWPGIRLIDTPGVDSIFTHNTETSLSWAPHVDMALVSIGVDPPLSQQDLDLLRKLSAYTSQLAVLLTKIDLLMPSEVGEITKFIHDQLQQSLGKDIPIYCYSTRQGYAHLRVQFEQTCLVPLVTDTDRRKRDILHRKLLTLATECRGYLQLALKLAETRRAQQAEFQMQTAVQPEFFADTQSTIQLAARHVTASLRSTIEGKLLSTEPVITQELLQIFKQDRLAFPRSMGLLLTAFENWLQKALSTYLTNLSQQQKTEIVQPVYALQQQYQRLLQTFRDQLSERTQALYGVPLRTTEPEMIIKPPALPDVKIGRVFDHNWELLSPVLPMVLLRRSVESRFRRKISDETHKSLSRLTTQWEQALKGAISDLRSEAQRRLQELVLTVERLTSQLPEAPSQLREDCEQLVAASRQLE